MKDRVPLVIFLCAVGFPLSASANAGTPLMWATALHLLFGNALIGIFEGLLVARLVPISKEKAISAMILANYFSAWVGGVFLGGAVAGMSPIDVNTGWRWFWIMVGVTYVLTLVLEWPFVAWCFPKTKDWRRRTVRASLIVQSSSYVLLFGCYWFASGTSLYTRMSIVAPSELSLPESVLVYYISAVDGDVYVRPLRGGGEHKVQQLGSADMKDRLFMRPNANNPKCWDLMARLETEDHQNPRLVEVKTNMLVDAPAERRDAANEPIPVPGTWFNFGPVQPLGSMTNSAWEFWVGFWSIEGLRATNKISGERVRFSFETQYINWMVRNAVHLPSDKVLFQLGTDQICAFDPVSRRVALLWHGRGPVPVIPKRETDVGGPPDRPAVSLLGGTDGSAVRD